jgi:hypothetical protein
MPDIKFDQTLSLIAAVEPIGTGLSDSEIIRIAGSFKENMRRVVRLLELSPVLAGWTGTFVYYDVQADFEVFGVPVRSPNTEALDPERTERVETLKKERFAREFPDFKKNRAETPPAILTRGKEYLRQLCSIVPQVAGGLDVVLASSITGSWTAFEVLAGDLWTAAVNAHPHTLSEMKGKLVKWEIPKAARGTEEKERESGNKKGAEAGPQISIKWLQFHNYNVSQKMGTLLRQRRSADFQTVWDIRDAYARAFESDYSAIRDSLADESIDYLSALRNVLVHKAGNADTKFTEDIAGCQHFASISETDPVILDGEIVADLLWAVVNKAGALLSAVDAWLVRNPNKSNVKQ